MSEKVYTQADYDALMEPMRCGHYSANLTRSDGGADICIVCHEMAAKDAELARLRGVVKRAESAVRRWEDWWDKIHGQKEPMPVHYKALPAPAELVCPACGPVTGKHPDVCSFTPQPVEKCCIRDGVHHPPPFCEGNGPCHYTGDWSGAFPAPAEAGEKPEPGSLDTDIEWVRQDRDGWEKAFNDLMARVRKALSIGRATGYDGHWETVPGQMLMALDPIKPAAPSDAKAGER